MLKFKLLIGALALSTALVSCNPAGSGGYSFTNQDLQGKIGGASWAYVSGTAQDLFADGNLWVDLYDIAPAHGNPWALDAYTAAQNKILFIIPASVGLQELSVAGQKVTLYDYSTGYNNICVEGAVEILTIDAVNHVVTGRIDARMDSDNYVNGNFTAAYQ